MSFNAIISLNLHYEASEKYLSSASDLKTSFECTVNIITGCITSAFSSPSVFSIPYTYMHMTPNILFTMQLILLGVQCTCSCKPVAGLDCICWKKNSIILLNYNNKYNGPSGEVNLVSLTDNSLADSRHFIYTLLYR